MVYWFNFFFEAMKNLKITTIVGNVDIQNQTILLVIQTFIVFSWNYIGGGGKLTYAFLYFKLIHVLFLLVTYWAVHAKKNLIDASHITYLFLILNMFLKKKHKLFKYIFMYELNIYYYIYWIYMNWIYIKLLQCQSKGEISIWGRSSVTEIRNRILICPILHSVASQCWMKYGWF
jgi:hypothetical protein